MNRIYLLPLILAVSLAMAACAVTSKRATQDSVLGSFFHSKTESTPAAPSQLNTAPRRLTLVYGASSIIRPARKKLASVIAEFKPLSPESTASLAAVLPPQELAKADSLLNSLQTQNKKADRIERKIIREKKERDSFPFKPTNINPQDTIYIDARGVKLALWIGPNGIEQKVARGAVLSEEKNGEEIDVLIEPGFNWQPYQTALLVLSCVATAAIVSGFVYSICTKTA